MSTTDKNIIEDKNIREAIKEVEKIAKEGISGNPVIHKKEITKNDLTKLDEGRPYINQRHGENPRLSFRVNGKLFHILMTESDN